MENYNNAPMIKIGGVDQEHAEAVASAISSILNTARPDDVVKHALDIFAQVAEVKNVNITNSHFDGRKINNVSLDD